MRSIKHFLLFSLVILVLAVSNAWFQKRVEMPLPATPVGKAAQGFLESLNRGDEKALSAFVGANFSERALAEAPAADRVKLFAKVFKQSGGLEPRIVSPDSGERFLVVDVRGRRSAHWARMFFVLSREQPERFAEIGLFGIPDPEKAAADPWPESRMPEAAAIKEIGRRAARLESDDLFSGVILIATGDKVVFSQAYGYADRAHNAKNTVDTKFNLASMNKMFTAVAIGQLVDAGKLSFDNTIAEVLPDYPNKEVAAKIRISHLLSHSSGLGDFFDNPEFRPFRERYRDPSDYFKLFAQQPLRFEPGTRFGYSNAGFIVLGAIIEKASGMGYFEYVREKIYRPAGMLNTDSFELTEVVPNLAIGYARFDDDPLGIEPRRSNIAFLPWKGSPAGGGYSTAPDLLRFAIALRENRLVSAKTAEVLTTPKLPMVGSPRPGTYGYGFLQQAYGTKATFGHGGGGAQSGIANAMSMFRDGSYTVIVLGNYDPPTAENLHNEIVRLLARI